MAENMIPGGFLGPGGLQIPPPAPETLHETYVVGANAGDQTLNLLDVNGGGVTIDGTAGGFTGIYGLRVLANQYISRSLAVGVDAGVQPSARLHMAAGTAVAGTAPFKLDPGVLLGVTESGAVESDGTNVYWTDAVGTRWPLNNAAAETLAQAYAAGAVAFDQTLNLLDAKGGGVALNATTPLQVFVTAFSIGAIGGSVNFYRVGGFDVSSSVSVPVAAGANWNEVNFLASTITLTGGPSTANVLSMVRIGSGIVNGVGNTAIDSYNLLVDAAPIGTATLTRSWSAGFAGAVQAQTGFVLGVGLNPPTESDLVVGAGATVVSQANSGRLGYLAGATQTFMVSTNGGAYVPLLVGPAAGGFTTGSVPFGIAGGQLGQDNANLFWDNTNKRFGIGIAPTATLHVLGSASVRLELSTITGSSNLNLRADYTSGPSVPAGAQIGCISARVTVNTGVVTDYERANITFLTTSTAPKFRPATDIIFSTTADNAVGVIERMRITADGNVVIGAAPAGISRLQVVATASLAAAAGAAWNGINFAASILTLTGATTPVTTLNFVSIAGPTITAASPVVTTDFYTCRIGVATFIGAGPASATRNWCLGVDGNVKLGGGITTFGRQILIGASPYNVAEADFVLEVQSNGGAITVNLPALTGGTILNGRIVVIMDSGYSAGASNITVARGNVADKINNVAGSYTVNVNGACIWLRANTTNANWEII